LQQQQQQQWQRLLIHHHRGLLAVSQQVLEHMHLQVLLPNGLRHCCLRCMLIAAAVLLAYLAVAVVLQLQADLRQLLLLLLLL
jgi:hypothetical protein